MIGFLVCLFTLLVVMLFGSPETLLDWSGAGLVVFVLLPFVVTRVHLTMTNDLTDGEKEAWEEQMGWGASGFLVAPFYLIRKDRRLSGRAWSRRR